MNPCPVCGSDDATPHGPYRGRHPAFADLRRASCRACGLVYADPMPGAEALHGFNASYYDSAHGVASQPEAPAVRHYHSGINRIRLDHVLDYCARAGVEPGSVLEVGPGHGLFAHHLLEAFPDTRYWAVESDVSCLPDLERMGVRVAADPADLPAEARDLDLAVASHVLEHVADPRALVAGLLGRLRPGGVLFIEVPCRDHEHKELDEPHLLFFDKPAMGRLLSDAGAREIELTYHGRRLSELTSPAARAATVLRKVVRRLGAGALLPSDAKPGVFGDEGGAEEWQVVERFKAHRTWDEPAWWLRALAVRGD
ncbi:MAG: methyltransferase domain-containing protein [Longimicrobiales bacterium]